jgi:hypothetical protein
MRNSSPFSTTPASSSLFAAMRPPHKTAPVL